MLLLLLAATLPGTVDRARAATAGSPGEPPVRFPVVFFPPEPPVYGAYIDQRPAATRWLFNGRRLTPPDGLAEFVGEILYPPLSTRLYSAKLSRPLEARIDRYRGRRNALVNALLEQCLTLHDASEEARVEGLRAFAALQTPLLAALETEAEALRRDLARNSLWSVVDWNTQRNWRLDSFPPTRDWANLEAEFQVVRAAAYYEDGLTAAQRGLLRELALVLARRARQARGEPTGRYESDAMFFSPETTRLRLPRDLPSPVLRRIAAYNARKEELKRQLREVIHQQEAASREERAAAFARLAEEQWPHFGNLEALADEIRIDLAPRFVPQPPSQAPPLPAWLVAIIHPYNEERNAHYDELREAVRVAVAQVPRPPRSDDSDEQQRQEQAYRAQRQAAEFQVTQDFEHTHAARIADLTRRCLAIRTALEAIARTTLDPKTGRPINVDTLLRRHATAMDEFDLFGWVTTVYTNYRTAMLQRGLSPEQRRLLFSHAVAALAQPLPYGEPIPNRKAQIPMPR